MPEIEAPESPAVADEAILPSDSPAAPEGVAPSAPGDEPATTEPAAALSTRPRGPDGRFIKADGTQASEAEHAAIEAAGPASPPPAAIPTPAAPSAPPGEPFVFRADGQKIPIPGSSVSPDGHLTIPAEQVPVIRQLLAEGVSHRGSWRTREQDYQRQIQEAGAVSEAKVQKYNEAAVFLFDLIADPAKLQALTENPERIELVRERLGLMLQRADLKVPAAPKAETAESQGPQEQDARNALDEELETLLDGPQARTLYTSPDERRAVLARFQRRLNAYFVQHEGEIVLDRLILKEDFEDELKVRVQASRAAADAAKAAAFNAKRNVPPPATPPVVSPKGPGSTGIPNRPQFKTRDEYNKAMGLS